APRPQEASAPSSGALIFKSRDGYRTRQNPSVLGPVVQYYLPTAPDGAVTIDILDAKGAAVNSYNSNAAAPGGGGRGGGGARGGGGGAGAQAAGAGAAAEPPDPEAGGGGGGGFGRGGGGVVSRVTKDAGMNRFVWNVQHQSGLTAPPGAYQARLKVGETVVGTVPMNVLIDPRNAAGGVTVADLQEQFNHNMNMRELTAAVTQTVTRVRGARGQLANATGADVDKKTRIEAIYEQLVASPEGVRYNKPGLQQHVTYLAGM